MPNQVAGNTGRYVNSFHSVAPSSGNVSSATPIWILADHAINADIMFLASPFSHKVIKGFFCRRSPATPNLQS